MITVSATFSDGLYREKRKGRGAKPYEIPIHPEMMEFISERVKNNLPEAYLFVNPRTGGHYSETTMKRVWDNIKKRAGIVKPIRLYDASRHSFGSNLIDKGCSPYKVSKLMGHSSIKVTEKYYLHNDAKSLRTDLEKLSLKKVATVPRVSSEPIRKSGQRIVWESAICGFTLLCNGGMI